MQTMTPALKFMGCWHALYWIYHTVFRRTLPWYKKPNDGNVATYCRKLRLVKKGEQPTRVQAAVASGYFQNYMVTSSLAATHGIIQVHDTNMLVIVVRTEFGCQL